MRDSQFEGGINAEGSLELDPLKSKLNIRQG